MENWKKRGVELMAILNQDTTIGGVNVYDAIAGGGKVYGPVTTTGTGSAYVATIEDGPESLYTGLLLVIIPHTISMSTTPTLNVNSLGAKRVCLYGDEDTSAILSPGALDTYHANKPLLLMYDGSYFRVLNFNEVLWSNINGKPSDYNFLMKANTGTTQYATFSAIPSPSTDLNSSWAIVSGTASDGPVSISGHWNVIQMPGSLNIANTSGLQLAMSCKSDSGDAEAYIRYKYNGSWKDWQQLGGANGTAIPPSSSTSALDGATSIQLLGIQEAQTAEDEEFVAPEGETLVGQLPSSKGSYYVTTIVNSTTTNCVISFKLYNSSTFAYVRTLTNTISERVRSYDILMGADGTFWIAFTPYSVTNTGGNKLRRIYMSSSSSTSFTTSYTRTFTETEIKKYAGGTSASYQYRPYLTLFFANGQHCWAGLTTCPSSTTSSTRSYSDYLLHISSSTALEEDTDFRFKTIMESDYAGSAILGMNYGSYAYGFENISNSSRDYCTIYAINSSGTKTQIWYDDDIQFTPSKFNKKLQGWWREATSGSGTFAYLIRTLYRLNGASALTAKNLSGKYWSDRQMIYMEAVGNLNYVIFKLVSNDEGYNENESGGIGLGLYSFDKNEFIYIWPFTGKYESCRLDVAKNRFYINQGDGTELVYTFATLPTTS